MTTILIDNTSEELDAPDWVTIPTGRGTLGGSVSRANNTKDLTSFSFTFNGSLVDIYVVVSPFDPPNLPSYVTISLDKEEWSSNAPSSFGEWRRRPLQVLKRLFSASVADGYHTISVTNFPPQYSLDYITILKPHESFWNTDVVIQDDAGGVIEYTGQWDYRPANESSGSVYPLPSSEEYVFSEPHLGTIHRAVSVTPLVKTSAIYNFIGTAVFVYGTLESSYTDDVSLTVAFNIDGSETKRTYSPGTVPQPNFLWFGLTTLPLTSHTLHIDVLELNGTAFVLDYIISKPGPDILRDDSPPGQLSPPFSSSVKIPEKPDWSLPNSTNAETWGYTKSNQSSKSVIIGASVGVVGGLLVIVGVLLFWLRYRLRRKKGRASKDGNRDDRRPFAM